MNSGDNTNNHSTGPNNGEGRSPEKHEHLYDLTHISDMYQDWFLDYASYVIMERAVPTLDDGLKPVQRRILHAMREMHDGRFHKVANIIGQTMQYHPHGDAAIGDALVNLGQKELLLETQGNWGDIRTGDSAAAPRYIEARLSRFALEVVFNPEITGWQLAYDGRKKEPAILPVKFPLVLAQGIEGIAVGLSTKIMPHNFIELIDAAVRYLKGKDFELYPDFPTGGLMEIDQYNEGRKGGRIRLRAKIEEADKKALIVKAIPYGTTTNTLIDSIIKANDQGKIKVRKVVDNTAEDVEILVELPKGADPDVTIDALYAFTDCEISIAPNACVIIGDKPHFLSVKEILRRSVDQARDLLRRELEIKQKHLEDRWHFSSLEKIFIEKRIYRRIEDCETWEDVLGTIDKGLQPYKKLFKRTITHEDIIKLTEIKIKRISKYDSFKADEVIRDIEEELEQTRYNLEHLRDFAINYFKGLKEKYSRGRERKTEIRSFEDIDVQEVAVQNQKLFVNRKDGFLGTALKKDEFVVECSEVDDLIVFYGNGKFKVIRVPEKAYVGKGIVHVDVWKRNDDRTIYNVIYSDGETGITRAKRFAVKSCTRDREYDLTRGTQYTRQLYFSANPNGETEVVTVKLSPACRARKKKFDFDFSTLDIKGRNSQGNIITRYPVKKVKFKEKGEPTLGGYDIWYSPDTGRLNNDKKGMYLGNFAKNDQILVIYENGTYEQTNFELTNRYDPERVCYIEKFDPRKAITAVYFDGESKRYYVKRFQVETTRLDQEFTFITEHEKSGLLLVTTQDEPHIQLVTKKKKKKKKEQVNLSEFIGVKGWKALGNILTQDKVDKITLVDTAEDQPGEEGKNENTGNDNSNKLSGEQDKNQKGPDTQMTLFE